MKLCNTHMADCKVTFHKVQKIGNKFIEPHQNYLGQLYIQERHSYRKNAQIYKGVGFNPVKV